MNRGGAAAKTWIVCGRVTATPQPQCGSSFDESRRRRGRDVDRPRGDRRRRYPDSPTRPVTGDACNEAQVAAVCAALDYVLAQRRVEAGVVEVDDEIE